MHKRNEYSPGFTIVELIIVIVVIAILAAISVVAYVNIQDRAYDSAVQNDLTNFAKTIQLAGVDSGDYPAGGATQTSFASLGSSQHTFPGFGFNPSKSAYWTQSQNFYYCTGTETASGQKIYQIRARSKSGNSFLYKSNGGIQNLGNVSTGYYYVGGSSPHACQGMDFPVTWSYGYYNGSNTWFGWTN